jgi:methionyl-tRNA synthetase
MISPLAMRERYGFDAFRFFLLRDMSFGLDANFSEEAMVARINADLANNLGNLVSRTLNMTARFADGRVPEPPPPEDLEREMLATLDETARAVDASMRAVELHRALEAIFRAVDAANRYLDARAPWKAAKREGGDVVVRASLYTTCQMLRGIALLLHPFIPDASGEILGRLGLGQLARTARLPEAASDVSALPPGTETRKGAPLFPRIELPENDG